MKRRAATAEEAKALAHPLRLRILRLCLDEALTNKQLAQQLHKDPATLLHHVRTLERTGFLAVQDERRGPRGRLEKPYRATGKSWTLDVGLESSASLAMIDAFRAELLESPDLVTTSRFAPRLRAGDREELVRRLEALANEFVGRDDPDGEPLGVFIAVHRRVRPTG